VVFDTFLYMYVYIYMYVFIYMYVYIYICRACDRRLGAREVFELALTLDSYGSSVKRLMRGVWQISSVPVVLFKFFFNS